MVSRLTESAHSSCASAGPDAVVAGSAAVSDSSTVVYVALEADAGVTGSAELVSLGGVASCERSTRLATRSDPPTKAGELTKSADVGSRAGVHSVGGSRASLREGQPRSAHHADEVRRSGSRWVRR